MVETWLSTCSCDCCQQVVPMRCRDAPICQIKEVMILVRLSRDVWHLTAFLLQFIFLELFSSSNTSPSSISKFQDHISKPFVARKKILSRRDLHRLVERVLLFAEKEVPVEELEYVKKSCAIVGR